MKILNLYKTYFIVTLTYLKMFVLMRCCLGVDQGNFECTVRSFHLNFNMDNFY